MTKPASPRRTEPTPHRGSGGSGPSRATSATDSVSIPVAWPRAAGHRRALRQPRTGEIADH